MKLILKLTLTFLLFYSLTSLAQPVDSRVPGGIAIIPLDEAQGAPHFTFRKKPVLTTELKGQSVAIVGIPLSLKAGEFFITGSYGNRKHRVKKFFRIKDKQYTTQRITIKNKRKVNPLEKDMDRIIREKKRKGKASSYWSNEDPQVDFLTPIDGIMTGSFGKRRIFNGQARRPHSGMDIAADKGVPVASPADGAVIESGDFFFSGNMVYIHHGRGLITLFAHLDRIDVKVGERIKKGQIIGTVGETGRVTGPHLHWSVGLNGNWVNPSLFIAQDEN